MLELTVDRAVEFARKSIDEILPNESSMFGQQDDDRCIRDIISASLPESVIHIHSAAPSDMLEGIAAVPDTDYTVSVSDCVLRISMLTDVLRIVRMQAYDSCIPVTSTVHQDSPEGRMQLNPYIRGTFDAPVLVLQKESKGHRPVLRYYTLKTSGREADRCIRSLEYIPMPVEGAESHMVASQCEYAVLNHVTGMLLSSFKDDQRAEYFYGKAAGWIKQARS